MRKFVWAGLLAVSVIGCSGGSAARDSTEANNSAAGTEGKKLTVGLVFDSGGRGDKSFNDSAYAGLERAQKELGITPRTVDSKTEKDYEANLTALAESGVDVIFAVGITQSNALAAVAPKFPNLKFGIIDGNVEGPNVRSLQFAEHEGSFLAGYAAGLVTKTNKLGFVGGMSIPLIKKFEAGYIAGAKTANPAIEVLPAKYTESWNDASLGKAAASVLFSGGADVVYHAAGRCGLGVIAAAKDAGKYAIGVDSDQDDVEPGTVLTSMIKRVDEAVFQTIKDSSEDKFTAGVKAYDTASNGVGLSPMKNTKDKVGADNLAKIEEMRKKIAAGEIKVPTNAEELAAYVSGLK